ncbi:Threonine efflux protein [Marinomonas spartinae]|uniref:LysE family translocator n=1 Tax=Marinomonas spartinae TaxID=1792290 RepID=UPI000808FA34|nr:LysE family translocator [Marinomonas spartinae]SBS39212.1 Threonine efflux protein [Marinomonas spartinae]
MISISIITVYISVAFLSYITPGPDWLIISQNTFKNKRSGIISALGVQSGLFFHMILSVVGAYAVLLASEQTLIIIQLLGSLYIIWLGYSSIADTLKKHKAIETEDINESYSKSRHSAYLSGFIANVLNPKAAIFFFSILPQFVDKNSNIAHQILILGIIDIIIGFFWWLIFVSLINKINIIINDRKIQTKIELFTGSILTILGVLFLIKALI